MSELVDATEIERIVGVRRHPEVHVGRAVSDEQTVYILHSQPCLDSGLDLRECPYSVALDAGIDLDIWDDWQDRAVAVVVERGELLPVCPMPQPTDQEDGQ